MREEVQAAPDGDGGIEDRRSHEPSPQQRGPVVRLRHQWPVVQKAVVTGHEGIVRDDLHLLEGEAPELVEIAKAVEKGAAPRGAATRGVGRLSEPEGGSRVEAVP